MPEKIFNQCSSAHYTFISLANQTYTENDDHSLNLKIDRIQMCHPTFFEMKKAENKKEHKKSIRMHLFDQGRI